MILGAESTKSTCSSDENCLSKLTHRMGKFLKTFQNIDMNDSANILEELANFKLYFRNIQPDEFMSKLTRNRVEKDPDVQYWNECYHQTQNNFKNHVNMMNQSSEGFVGKQQGDAKSNFESKEIIHNSRKQIAHTGMDKSIESFKPSFPILNTKPITEDNQTKKHDNLEEVMSAIATKNEKIRQNIVERVKDSKDQSTTGIVKVTNQNVNQNKEPITISRAKIYMDKWKEMQVLFNHEMTGTKKLINTAINRIAINNESEIVADIKKIIFSIPLLDKNPPNVYFYFFGQTVVEQAVSQTTNLKKVLPYVEVTCELMNIFPEILNAVLGYIHTNCIFSIPNFSEESFASCKNIGFKEVDGNLENLSQFMNRMNDLILVYAMIIQYNPPGHRYGIEKGWEWIAAILNSVPNRFTIEVLDTFLRIAGYKMYESHKPQFAKMLEFIQGNLLSKPPLFSDKGSIFRLSCLIESFKKTNNIPKPHFLVN